MIAIEKEDEKSISFAVDAPVHFANLLRKYIMAKVPVLAFDEVIFYENSSSMFEEYISHRIGLIPLKTRYPISEKYEATSTIDVQGPVVVTSADIKGDAEPALKEIPIIRLKEGQVLRAELKARVGKGEEHAKFQPGLATYEKTKDGYKFYVETFYQHKPRKLLLAALNEIKKDCNSFSEEFSSWKK
ncbi:MAG: hypothetical protein QW035_03175 [Candidatus Anstonellales archaeon]